MEGPALEGECWGEAGRAGLCFHNLGAAGRGVGVGSSAVRGKTWLPLRAGRGSLTAHLSLRRERCGPTSRRVV